jgi:dihydroorotase-like cyclic amidohydrolase
MSLILTGRRILVDHEHDVEALTITVIEGKITSIVKGYMSNVEHAEEVIIDAGDLLVMPGVVDAHVNIELIDVLTLSRCT